MVLISLRILIASWKDDSGDLKTDDPISSEI
jgi:hypothetical protein